MFALATFLLLGLRLSAQSTQSELETRLLNEPLYLRGSWQEKKIEFDAAGNILGRCAKPNADNCSGSFTLGGMQVNEVDLHRDKLVLTGVRAGVKFQPSLARVLLPDPIRIEIAAPPDGDYEQALTKIFAVGFADLTPSLPELWQTYARKAFLKQELTGPVHLPSADSPHAPGGQVTAPVLESQLEPKFPPAAVQMGYRGSVLINIIVGKDGKPFAVHVLRPAGLGLDEAAADAVSNYRFKPAMEGGAPVNFELNIEVSFR